MSKYGLKLSELEFMSRVDHREVSYAEDWLVQIGAIRLHPHEITWKGQLMSEIPYEPDFAHMISTALIAGDYAMARFLLAGGAFGDSLNHAYKSDMEGIAREFLFAFDNSNELNVKAHLLKGYSGGEREAFARRLGANGVFTRFVDEAWKNYESAREGLNDLLQFSKKELIPREVVVNPEVLRLEPYLEDCLSFEKFDLYERRDYDLHGVLVEGPFYARTVTMNYRKILYDIVAVNTPEKHRHKRGS